MIYYVFIRYVLLGNHKYSTAMFGTQI